MPVNQRPMRRCRNVLMKSTGAPITKPQKGKTSMVVLSARPFTPGKLLQITKRTYIIIIIVVQPSPPL